MDTGNLVCWRFAWGDAANGLWKACKTPFIMCQNKSTQEAQKQLLYITRGSLDALAEALLPFNGITATDGRTRTSVPRCGSCEFARAVPYESCVKLITRIVIGRAHVSRKRGT